MFLAILSFPSTNLLRLFTRSHTISVQRQVRKAMVESGLASKVDLGGKKAGVCRFLAGAGVYTSSEAKGTTNELTVKLTDSTLPTAARRATDGTILLRLAITCALAGRSGPAATAGTGNGVLEGGPFAVAVQSGALAARAGGFGGADASLVGFAAAG